MQISGKVWDFVAASGPVTDKGNEDATTEQGPEARDDRTCRRAELLEALPPSLTVASAAALATLTAHAGVRLQASKRWGDVGGAHSGFKTQSCRAHPRTTCKATLEIPSWPTKGEGLFPDSRQQLGHKRGAGRELVRSRSQPPNTTRSFPEKAA